MARIIDGTVNVSSAGTAVQLTSTADRILWIHFHARTGNTNNVYIGASTVASTRGKPVAANGTFELAPATYGRHTLLTTDVYIDADTNGNDCEWVALVE